MSWLKARSFRTRVEPVLTTECKWFAVGYLPEHCAKLDHRPPEFFECPSPYVEMTRSGKAKTFSRAWHCRETGHSLGVNRYGGSAGSKGLAMFPGWVVPAGAPAPAPASVAVAQKADFHAEVLEWVIEPCMEVAAALDVKKYDEETIKAGVKRTHIAKLMLATRDAAIGPGREPADDRAPARAHAGGNDRTLRASGPGFGTGRGGAGGGQHCGRYPGWIRRRSCKQDGDAEGMSLKDVSKRRDGEFATAIGNSIEQ